MTMRPSQHLLLSLLSALACALMCVPPAFAQEDGAGQERSGKERAEDLYSAAVQLYNAGQNRAAIAKFDEAIAVAPEPIFFCNRAIVLLKVDELDRAIDDLRECRDTIDPSLRPQIDAQLAAVELIDRAVLPDARSVAQLIANPAPAAPVAQTPPTDGEGGVSDKAPVPPEHRWMRRTGTIGLATGGFLLAGALTLDLLSTGLREEFEAQAAGGANTSEAEYEELRGRLRSRQIAFYSLSAAGLLVAVTGATFFVLGRDTSPRRATLRPTLTHRSASLSITWSF